MRISNIIGTVSLKLHFFTAKNICNLWW